MAVLLLNAAAIETLGKGIEASRRRVSLKDDRLTVRAHNRPLEWVLAAIARDGRAAVLRALRGGDTQVRVQTRYWWLRVYCCSSARVDRTVWGSCVGCGGCLLTGQSQRPQHQNNPRTMPLTVTYGKIGWTELGTESFIAHLRV
jgi:hypothetical protein